VALRLAGIDVELEWPDPPLHAATVSPAASNAAATAVLREHESNDSRAQAGTSHGHEENGGATQGVTLLSR
jgi:hypothetical protein